MTKIIGSAALTPGGDSGTDLTTKGDLHGFSDENTRIPISTNGFVLTADSTQALGLKWAEASTGAIELLDYEDFSVDAAAYVFTPSSALTADNYSEFRIAISGKTDAVNAIPTLIISDSVDNIYYMGETINGSGVRADLTGSDTGIIDICNATTIAAANKNFMAFMSLSINTTSNYVSGYMESMNLTNLLGERKFFEVETANISKIEINMTSTGKFRADTRFIMTGTKTS